MLPEQIIIIMFLLTCLINVIFSSKADDINISHCSDRWFEMNDENYADTVDRYKRCLELINRLKRDDRIKYKSKLGENIAISCKSFLDRTGFGPKGLVRVVRQVMRDLKPYLDEDEELEYANDYESIDNMKEQQSTYKTLIANVSTSNSNIVNQSISTTKKYETFSEFYDDMSGKSSKLKPKKFRPDFEKYFTKEVHVLMAFVVLIVVQIIVLILLLWNCYLHYRLVKQACKARPTVRLGFSSGNKSNESIQSGRTATTYHCPEINCGANNIGRAVGGGDALDIFHPANITSDVTPSTSAEMAARKLKHPIVAKKKSLAPSSISSSDLGSFTVTIYLNQ